MFGISIHTKSEDEDTHTHICHGVEECLQFARARRVGNGLSEAEVGIIGNEAYMGG
jgi:hypothetical protein